MTLSNQKRLPLACIGSLAVAMAAAVGCSSGPDVVMVGSAPEVEGEAPPVGRQSARMTVDQLNRSLTAVAGTDAAGDPIQWGFSNVYDFSDLGPILGDPNYIRVTEEPAIPNALYVKFMRDVASNVCGQMRDADAAKTPQDRVLLRFSDAAGQQSEADVEDNIRYLHLRFFGERIAEAYCARTDRGVGEALAN